MRTAGQWVSRLRRMSSELRTQSGIDDLIRDEGLEEHLHELRSLSRINVVDTFMAPVTTAFTSPMRSVVRDVDVTVSPPSLPESASSDREYPVIGCDAFGALSEDVAPYAPLVAADPPGPDDVYPPSASGDLPASGHSPASGALPASGHSPSPENTSA